MFFSNSLKEPIFLKESSNALAQKEQLERLLLTAPYDKKAEIERDIRLLSYGISGENAVSFELLNSHMPMYIIHDLFLTHNDLSAQIDYLVITKKANIVIECKNLFGDIEINGNGDFIRTTSYNGKTVKEGIYSPITQNKRHLELIKVIRGNEKGFFTKPLFELEFYNNYKAIVVLVNTKTILNARFAKKEVKEQVLRVDKLVEYIASINENKSRESASDAQMENLANFFLRANAVNDVDYTKKYNLSENATNIPLQKNVIDVPSNAPTDAMNQAPAINEKIIVALKKFRLETSRRENIKAYFIFNDKQLDNLILKMPTTIEQLKMISGFGETKSAKYGAEIIDILLNTK